MSLLVVLVLLRVCQMSPLDVISEVSIMIGQPVNITCSVTHKWHTLRIDINKQVAFYSKQGIHCENYAEKQQNITDICDITQRRFGIGFKSIRWEWNNTKVTFKLTYNDDNINTITEHKEIQETSRIFIEPISVILISNQTTAEKNGGMNFQCEAKGVEFVKPSIQWFKDSVSFPIKYPVNRLFRDTMISEIKIYPDLDDNGAILNCAVNIFGKIFKSDNQTITVDRGPVNVCIYQDLPTYVVASNENLSEIFCHSNCTPQCSYKWFSMSSGSVIGQNSSFPHQNSSQIGKYYCLAKNPRTGKEKNTTIQIYYIKYGENITITKSGLNNISENTSLILPCLEPNIKLLQLNEVENKSVNKKDIKRFSNFEDTVSMISNATCFNAGLYTCRTTNCHGNETLLKFNVSVLCHPYFLSGLTFIEKEVVIGKPIIITVRYTGYPPPTLMLNRSQLRDTNIRNKSFGFSMRENTQGLIYNARIYKAHAELGDHGTYFVEISNYIGKTKVNILIKVIFTSFDSKTTIVIGIIVASIVICIALLAITRKFGRQRFYKGIRKLWNRNRNGGSDDGANDDYRDNILYVSVDKFELRSSLEIGNHLFNEIHGQGDHLQIENNRNSDIVDENFDGASAGQSPVDNAYQSINDEVLTSHIDKGTKEQLTEGLGELSGNKESIDTDQREIDHSEQVTRKMCRKPVPLPRRIKETHC